MRRSPAKLCALLLVVWIGVVVISPTIDLPRTTLPARSNGASAGFLFIPVATLTAYLAYALAFILLQPGNELMVLGASRLIELKCSRLC